MSGTSLDGLDIALCQLDQSNEQWSYQLLKTSTSPYHPDLKSKLQQAVHLNGLDLQKLHRSYGLWLSAQVNNFIEHNGCQPDLIASHGHTVFHEPNKRINFQVGDGHVIAAQTGITTISDFRSLDICLNGQGAPLVPIGDQLLFGSYAACVNLGGFANVSCTIDGNRKAWDICPVNFVTNRLMQQVNKDMDYNGELGKTGHIITALLEQLNALSYYGDNAPKSLAQEWVDSEFMPLLDTYKSHPLKNLLRTCYEHFATIISNDLNTLPEGEILFTGGGVYNIYLMQLIKQKTRHQVMVPKADLIEFKEALIFALLGVLRITGHINCLSSVTGADCDSSSGIIHWGRK